MNCKDARPIVYTISYPDVITPEMLEARRHLEECRECKEFLDGEREFVMRLRGAVKREPAPEGLRRRIMGMERQQKDYSRKRMFYGFVIGVVFSVLAVVGYILSTYKGQASFIAMLVDDHVKFLPLPEVQINSSDPQEIKAWFVGKVDFPVIIPPLEASLEGGRLCYLNKRRLALLFYRYDSSVLSLFIMDGIRSEEFRSLKKTTLKGKEVFLQYRSGYSVVLWEEKGLSYVLVSDLDIDQIKGIL